MGEIKSTLDLVMERTRHLSLSAEEKEAQRREAFGKRLQGLLQQYADGAMPMDELQDRMTALGKETGVTGNRLSVKAVLDRIDPDQDNDRWLALLEHLAPAIGRPLVAMLAAYKEDQAVLLQTGQKQLREQLFQDHGIAGAAVVPNPRQDPAIQKNLMALRNETTGKVEKLLQEMP